MSTLESDTDSIAAGSVRSRSMHGRNIHRQHPDTTDPLPACGEMHRECDWKPVQNPDSLLAFERFRPCDNPECYGDDGIHRGKPLGGGD